jgi:type I restriction enzyme S subunit
MTEGGDFDKLGRGFVWEGQIEGCLHQNHVFAVRPNPQKLDSHYLACLMTSSHGKAYFTSTSQQTTNLASTNSTKLGDFLLPLPPVEEQKYIVAELMNSISVVDRQIKLLRSSIEKFREYRQALITAAVTGKLDVAKEMC